MSIPKMNSVSGNLLQIMKLCVNLNFAMCKCMAVVPIADIGDLSAVFSVAVVDCMGIL